MNSFTLRRCSCFLRQALQQTHHFQRPNLQSIANGQQRILHNLSMHHNLLASPSILVTPQRYASKKAKKKKGTPVVSGGSSKIDTSVGDGIYDLNSVKQDMERNVERLKDEMKHKFQGTLTLSTIDNIFVTLDGTSSQLFEIAQCTALEKEFVIQPMVKGKNIEKQIIDGINHTGLNLRPRLTEKTITIDKPISNTEYKTNLMKLAKGSAEKSKNNIRKIRQQAFSQLKKIKDASKDEIKMIEKQVELLTENSNQSIDKMIDSKKKELKL